MKSRKRLWISIITVIAAIFLGLNTSHLIFVYHFQKNDISRLSVFVIIMAGLLAALLSYLLLHIGFPLIRKEVWFNSRLLLLLAGIALIFILELAIFIETPRNHLLYPVQTLEITINEKNYLNPNHNKVELIWFDTELGEVINSEIRSEGDWEVINDKFVSSGKQISTLAWNGRTGKTATLVFQAQPTGGVAEVVWNDEHDFVDLYSETEIEFSLRRSFDIPPWSKTVVIASRIIITIFSFLFVLFCIIFITKSNTVDKLANLLITRFSQTRFITRINQLSRSEVVIIIVLAAVAAWTTYVRATSINPVVFNTGDIWFDGDIHRMFQMMDDQFAERHFYTDVHPLSLWPYFPLHLF